MLPTIKRWFQAPIFLDDEDKSRVAGMLNVILLVLLGAMLVALLLAAFGGVGITNREFFDFSIIFGPSVAIFLLVLLHKGYVRFAAWIFVFFQWFTSVTQVLGSGGLQSPAMSAFIVTILLAGFLLGSRAIFLFGGLSTLSILATWRLQVNGELPQHLVFDDPQAKVFFLLTVIVIISALLSLVTRTLNESLTRSKRYSQRIELLHAIDRALLTAGSLEAITKAAVVRIRQLIPSLRASISLLDLAKNEAWFPAADYDGKAELPRTPITLQEYGQHIIDVIKDNRPFFMNDVLTDPGAMELDKRLINDGIRAWVFLPLLYKGQLIGSLNLGRGEPFKTYEAATAQDIANQLAIAIQQTRLYDALQSELVEHKKTEEKLEEQADDLSFINQIVISLFASPNLMDAMRKLVAELNKLMPIDTFYLGLYDSATDVISYPLFLVNGEDRDVPARKLKSVPSLSDEVISGLKTFYITDLADPVTKEKHPYVAIGEMKVRSFVGIPLFVQNKVVGMISVQHHQPGVYSEKNINLLEMLGIQLAVAVERLRLIDDLNKELEERKRVEKERESFIHELETRNEEMERFTYTVSHDLRSPLVTIKGFLGMLEKDLEQNRPDLIKADFQRIANAADKMNVLLSDLLELSRIGRITNPPEEVDLIQLSRDALENLDARLRLHPVVVEISPSLPVVHGDRVRLLEVFQNLIDNAAKYLVDQPDPVIEIGVRKNGTETILFIRDNGVGIDPQYHTRIFGLFEKLDPRSEGTGVGLALVKRIIEHQGGRIWVESEGIGKGSTFCFTLADQSGKN